MRLRLLIRRLSVSSPRVAVRSALPWPFRWAVLAVVFGFCAAIELWAFQLGREIAELNGGAKIELQQARPKLVTLQAKLSAAVMARDQAQTIADTAGTLVNTEKEATTGLMAQNRQLDVENRKLKDDLGFFKKLIPSTGGEGIAVRGLQAELLNGSQTKWQVGVMQSQKNAPEFNGRLEVSITGTSQGKPWTGALPGGAQDLKFRQYGRTEGLFELPAQTTVKNVSV